jgi:hypothetical protein
MGTFDLDLVLGSLKSNESVTRGRPVTDAPPWLTAALVKTYVRPN